MVRAVITPKQETKKIVQAWEIRRELLICLGPEGLAGGKELEQFMAKPEAIPRGWRKVGFFYLFLGDVERSEVYPEFTRYLRWDGQDWAVRPCSLEEVLGERDFVVLNSGF